MFVLRRAQWALNNLWCHVKGDSAVEEGGIFFLGTLLKKGCYRNTLCMGLFRNNTFSGNRSGRGVRANTSA